MGGRVMLHVDNPTRQAFDAIVNAISSLMGCGERWVDSTYLGVVLQTN